MRFAAALLPGLVMSTLLGQDRVVDWDQIKDKLALQSARLEAPSPGPSRLPPGVKLEFRITEAVAGLAKDQIVVVPYERGGLFVSRAQFPGAAPSTRCKGSTVAFETFQGRRLMILTPNLFMEHFRLRSAVPVGIRRTGRGGAEALRVTFQSIAPIAFPRAQALPVGTTVYARASRTAASFQVDFFDPVWSSPDGLLGPNAQPLEDLVLVALPSGGDSLSLADFRTFSSDERRTIDWWLKDVALRSPLGVPIEVDLYTGASWSNLNRSQGSQTFLEERALLRLEARKFWFIRPWQDTLIATEVDAELAPERTYGFEGTAPDGREAIRTTRSVTGAMELAVYRAISEYAGLGGGVRFTTSHSKDALANGSANGEKAYTQRNWFVRLLWHDPKWKGTFMEIGPSAWDPFFADPKVPGNEKRIITRGRLCFRPDSYVAASFFLEGTVNRSRQVATQLPDESRIILGMRIDMKNFFLPSLFK